jgi:hypothetical protein
LAKYKHPWHLLTTSLASPRTVDECGLTDIGNSKEESIKILLEGDGDSNNTNTASNTRLRLTTQVGQAHVATGVPLDLRTNTQPSEPKHTNTHSRNLHSLLPVLHQSDRWPAPVRLVTPVRPVDSAGQAGGYSNRTTRGPESLSDFYRPWNKTTPKTQPARDENPTQNLKKCHTCFSKEKQVQTYMHARIKFHAYSDI